MCRWPADEFIEMPPIGFMHDRVGIGRRLDHASPSRFKRHSQTLLVKITTDQGLIGWGEAHAPAAPTVHAQVITDLLAPILIGQDARRIGPLWDKMYSSQRLRGYATGFFTESIAGVDIALWDILGKFAGVPLCQLIVYRPIARLAVQKQRWRRWKPALRRLRWGFPRASAPKILHGCF